MSDFSINTQESEYSPSVDISKNFSDKRAQQDDADIQRILTDMRARQPQQDIQDPQKALPRAVKAATDDEKEKEDVGVVEDIAVRGVVGGIRDAVQEGGEAITELADYLTGEYGDLGALQIFDKEGNFNLDYVSRDQAKKENTLLKMNIPEIQQPNGIAANITRGVSQFVTGFIPALKGVKGLTAGAKLTKGTKAAQLTVAGAISDFAVFDPHAERLSNLANEYPALKNPLTDYLAADPTDSSAEGRFKNVVESLILDATLAGAFTSAVKVMRSSDKVATADSSALKEIGVKEKPPVKIIDETKPSIEEIESITATKSDAEKQFGEEADRLIKNEAGDVDLSDPKFSKLRESKVASLAQQAGVRIEDVTGSQVDVFSAGIKLERGGKAFNINLDRLDTTDDIQNIINTTSKVFSRDIDVARRGVVSQADTRQAAEQIGMTPEQLLTRQEGEAFNAEGIVAARDILVSSGKNLQVMAKAIQEGKATDIDRVKFRQAVATHAAIQKQVSGLTAEAGRALQAFRIGAEDQVAQTRAINNLIRENGGRDAIDQMAESMASLDDPAKLNQLVNKSWSASSLDMVFEAWTNSLLSAPSTHMTNIAGNTLVAMSQIPERAMSAIISKLPLGSGEISFHEASGLAYGMSRGAVDGWKMAKESFRTEGMNDPLTKLDVNDRRAITAENFSRTVVGKHVVNPLLRTVGAKDLDNAGMASSFVDFTGSAVRFFGYRMLSSEDAFFKGLNYRMELQAQAYRDASNAGLTGDEMAQRITQVMENPPANIRETAMTAADVNTYTNYNELATKVNAFRNAFPLLKFPLPFVTTPANIVAYAAKRTPLAPLAKSFREDVAAGGSRRDLALGRMATGSLAMIGFHNLASQGVITGGAPSDPALRSIWLQENQEYSFKLTGEDGKTTFVAYNRLDPIGMLAGIASDVYHIREGMSRKDEDDLISATMMAMYNNLLSKTYMTGISDIMSALDFEEPQGKNLSDIAANTVAGLVPNILNQANRTFVDPTIRDTKNVNVGFDNQASFIAKTIDKIKSKVAGYSSELPARRNLWGEVIEARQGFNDATGEMIYNFLSPAYVTKKDEDPVNGWLIDNDIGIRMPSRKMKLQGFRKPVQLSAQEYNTYLELSGKPAKKQLDNLIGSGRFDRMTDDKRSDAVRRIITGFRRQAKRDLLQLFPEITIRAQNIN